MFLAIGIFTIEGEKIMNEMLIAGILHG